MRVTWRNGRFTEEGFTENGFLEGKGIFETLRCEGTSIFALDRHMRRALTTGMKYGITIPHEDEIVSALTEVVAHSRFPVARMRALFTDDEFGLVYESYEENKGTCLLEIGPRSSHISRSEKTFPYDDRLELLRSAQHRGFDEILLVTDDGLATEGAVSNFIFRDTSGWFTTPLSLGVLPGVMRALYLDNLDIRVRPFDIRKITQISAGFAVSSLRLAQPITQIGHHTVSPDEESESMASAMREVALASSVLLAHG